MPGLLDTFLDDIGVSLLAPGPPQKPSRRELQPSQSTPPPETVSLAEARAGLRERLWAYARPENRIVTSKLLAAPLPGVGKTFGGVWVAEACALAGMRVAYVIPRHAFFLDIQAASIAQGGRPDLWYLWKPRHAEENRHGIPNCHWAGPMKTWTERGNTGMKFCLTVCGRNYIDGGHSGRDGCGYHQQEREAKQTIDGVPRIVAIQHNHVVTNHPLLKECDLVIGDESPLMSFCHPWHVPPAAFGADRPHDADQSRLALWALARRLRGLMDEGKPLEGDALYHALGGAEPMLRLLAACPDDELKGVHCDPERTEDMPWQWQTATIPLMRRELRAMRSGNPWMPRIRLDAEGLHLLLRRELSPDLPAKVIWLDATANVAMYEGVTRWPVEVYAPRVALQGSVRQVYDTLNTKGMAVDGDGQATERSKERARVVLELIRQQGYRRPLVVTYSHLVETFTKLGIEATYFYANRGSNRYQDCDAVIIYGTPQLPQAGIERAGQMLYQERMDPFRMEYSDQARAYAGQPWAYPTPGYWHEPGIQAILEMIREDEIEQSAHRVRPVNSPKPIWLLTGIPIQNLPPEELMTTLAMLLAHLPDDRRTKLLAMRLDAVRLCDAIDVASAEIQGKSYVTHFDLMTQMDVDERTAKKYVQAICLYDPERFPELAIMAAGPGPIPPPKVD